MNALVDMPSLLRDGPWGKVWATLLLSWAGFNRSIVCELIVLLLVDWMHGVRAQVLISF